MGEFMREDFGDWGDEALLGHDEYLREIAELHGMDYEERMKLLAEDAEPEDKDFADLNEDGGMSDVEADADTLASCGWGTDEDYGGGSYDY